MTKRQQSLAFEGGNIVIRTEGFDENGSGWLAFKDRDLEWDDEDTRFVNLPRSEMIAIRDFLIAHLKGNLHD